MKHTTLTAILFFLLPLSVQAESINSFISEITLSSEGSFSVVETITYDFGDEERHGIFRALPTSHPQESSAYFKERVIEIDIESITVGDEAVPFSTDEDLGELTVKIGDPDRTITGEHTYKLQYTVTGGLSYYDSGEIELYWNVTGNSWEVPMNEVEARILDPEGLTQDERHCYVGTVGTTEECAISTSTTAIIFVAEQLEPKEGLTIAQALDIALVEKQMVERFLLWPLWLVGALLWLLGLGWFSYRHLVAHKSTRSIVAEYEPYQDFKPMYTGVLFDGRVDSRDITAGIVYLAEQGFFKIKHTGRKMFFFFETDDYEITLSRPYNELQTDFQRTIFTLMFDKDAATGSSIALSELTKDTTKQKENYKLVNQLRTDAEADLIKQGFFEYRWRKLVQVGLTLLVGLLALLGLNAWLGADIAAPLAISVFTFVVSVIALAVSYRRRTLQGYEALDHLKGFKEFLSVTDKERFKFHNAPRKSPEQFMAFLPYAIAFGVEKEWAEVFKDISLPEPSWYEGQGHTFSAVYLSQSLGTFGDSVASASASSPASSGGGSVGGGVGGGGGGSW